MKKGLMVIVAVAALAVLAMPLTSFAGGSVAGKVTFGGKTESKEFSFAKFPNPKFCPKIPKKELSQGDKRLLETISVNGGGLAGAVVAVADIDDQAFIDGFKGTDVIAAFCEFQPYTGVVVPMKSFRVENTDADPDDPKSVKGVLHNPHSFEVMGASSSTIFNIGLAEKGSKLDKPAVMRKAKNGSFFRLQCDQHEFMQAFFLPVSNPHFAVTGKDGSFEIKDVPAGKHKLVIWHPGDGKGMRTEIEVDVTDGGKASVNQELKKK
ncbi:MAG: hypothetical protein ACKOBZ_07510 [Nitrospira sp.]|nr:carboxypeptidase-like regulatory domain-containing protein [Nitrospira sp.]